MNEWLDGWMVGWMDGWAIANLILRSEDSKIDFRFCVLLFNNLVRNKIIDTHKVYDYGLCAI